MIRSERHILAHRPCSVALTVLSMVACAAPAPPEAPVASRAAGASAPAPLAASRWVEVGATEIGPTFPAGTLVLLGGRRLVVASDGTARVETARAPEALRGLQEIVTASGARRVVAYSEHGVYRLDDLLGRPITLAHTSEETVVERVQAGPGVVAIWGESSTAPRFLDVETGQLVTLPQMPALPARAMAFKSVREGVCLFATGEVFATLDGGKTWAPLDADGSDLRELFGERPPASESEPASQSAVLRWIRERGGAPLVAAVDRGARLPSGEVLAGASNVVARIDLETGLLAPIDLRASPLPPIFQTDEEHDSTSVSMAGTTVWLGRARDEWISLVPVALRKAALVPLGPPLPGKRAYGRVRTAPSGAVMVGGSCSAEGESEARCVRQPSGKWKSVRPGVDSFDGRGDGPLADGRVAYFRGLSPTEGLSSEAGARPPPGARTSWMVAVDAAGQETTLATLHWPSAEPMKVDDQGHIEEGADGRLRAVLHDGVEPNVVVVAPSDRPVELTVRALAGMARANLHGQLGVAVGKDGLRGSTDGGATWSEIAVPARLREWIAAALDETGGRFPEYALSVSEVGLRVGPFVRIGWGAPEPVSDDRPSGGVTLEDTFTEAAEPEHVLTCVTTGAGAGTALLTAPQLLDSFPKHPLPPGTAVVRSFVRNDLAPGRVGGVVGENLKNAANPTMRFYWLDPTELGGLPRSASITMPVPRGEYVHLVSMDSSGPRAFFSAEDVVYRTKGAGMERAETPRTRAKRVAFGRSEADPIAWFGDDGQRIIVWPAGEAPRAIASIQMGFYARFRTEQDIVLGQPTKEDLPVFLLLWEGSFVKTLRIPPAPATPTQAPSRPERRRPPPPLGPEGWTRIPSLRGPLTRFPACIQDARGHRVSISAPGDGSATIDGITEQRGQTLFDLRVDGQSVCVARMAWMPTSRYGEFVRYDLIAHRAERVSLGLDGVPKVPVHALACKYEVKPPPSAPPAPTPEGR